MDKNVKRTANMLLVAQRMLQRAETSAPESMKKDVSDLKKSVDDAVEKHVKPLIPKPVQKILPVTPDIQRKNDR